MGTGLGFTFLRHIQRTRVIIHVLDGLSDDPLADFSQINAEMALFDPKLAEKPQVVVFNKVDLPDVQERWPRLKAALQKRGVKDPMAISAAAHQNLQPLMWRVYELVQNAPVPETAEALPVYRPAEDPREFSIKREPKGWRLSGAAIERAAAMTYWEHDASIRRFHHLMVHLGADEALRKAGIREGDMVFIGEYELEWQD